MKTLLTWLRDNDGATAIEYGMIVAGVALLIAAAVLIIGGDIGSVFNTINTHIEGVAATL